jgi:hypothetical protein
MTFMAVYVGLPARARPATGSAGMPEPDVDALRHIEGAIADWPFSRYCDARCKL